LNSFEFAINMEHDGEKYYLEQAEKNKGNGLSTVFLFLAKDEERHANILIKRLNKLPYELLDDNTLSKSKNIFRDISDFKSDIREIPQQIELYRVALEMEKRSIELYKDFLTKAPDDLEKLLFEYLVKQEEDHYAIIEELVISINRPNDWVESAEFVITKEY